MIKAGQMSSQTSSRTSSVALIIIVVIIIFRGLLSTKSGLSPHKLKCDTSRNVFCMIPAQSVINKACTGYTNLSTRGIHISFNKVFIVSFFFFNR